MWHLSSSRAQSIVSCDLYLIFVCSFKMWHFWLETSPGSPAYQFIKKHKCSQIRQEGPETAVPRGSQSMLTSFTACPGNTEPVRWAKGDHQCLLFDFLTVFTYFLHCWTLLLLLWFSEMFYFEHRNVYLCSTVLTGFYFPSCQTNTTWGKAFDIHLIIIFD